MAFEDLSESDKEVYNQAIKDEYSRLTDYQQREYREQMRDIFQVSDRTIRRWVSPTEKAGFLGKGKRGGKNADAKANLARGYLRNPPIREGVPTRSPKDYLGADKDKFNSNKFREYLNNDTIWTELNGHISWQSDTFFMKYAADSDSTESESEEFEFLF
jgi:hypothetical protein